MAGRWNLAERMDAFRHAGRGILEMLRGEPHARIHAAATLGVIAAGLGFGIARHEWIAIVLAVGAVWSLEAMNTAIEAVCDLVSPDHHDLARQAKDAAAGGVLLAAIAAVAVAAFVFGPRLWSAFV
jgi:diacylglycerol kinase (ATP)